MQNIRLQKEENQKIKEISKLVVKSFENEDKPVCKTYEKNGIYWPGWDEGGKEE